MDATGNGVLQGTTVKPQPRGADLLNSTFSTTALAGGLVIGIATITVPTS
ncbi:hypothetical protein [Actinophytocola sp.]